VRRPDCIGLGAIFARECRLAVGGASFWSLGAAGALLAAWRAAGREVTCGVAAYRASEIIVLGVGVVAVLLAGAAAARDRRQAVAQLVLAKPRGSAPALVLVRFAALWLSLAVLAAMVLAASALTQIAVAGTPWRVYPYAHALAYTMLPIGLAAALGFSLSTIFATPLASAVAALYWIVIPLTRAHIAIAFDLTLSQHWPLTALFLGFLIALTGALYARPVRDGGAATARLAWAAALLLGATVVAAYGIAASGDDALLGPDPVLAAIAAQSSHRDPRAPGFWLPDAHGRRVALSDYAGRPVALTFWGPAAANSVHALSLLRGLAAEFRSSGLVCIAVCVDRDSAAMRPFLRDGGSDVVMLWDRGRHFGDGTYLGDSPAAVGYEVTHLPATFILDRDRSIQYVLSEIPPDRVREKVAQVIDR